MALTSAQITICDLADPVVSGAEPENPVLDMLWTDTSQTPSVLKRWTGDAWEVVNEPVVGGTNLMYGTQYWTDKAFLDKGDASINENVLTVSQPNPSSGSYDADDPYPNSCCGHKIYVTGGERYMLGFDVSGDTVGPYEVLCVRICRLDSEGEKEEVLETVSVETSVTSFWKRVTKTISVPEDADYVYFVFQPKAANDTKYQYVKFEKGTVATSWNPAPEDYYEETKKVTKIVSEVIETQTDHSKEISAIKTTTKSINDSITDITTKQSNLKQTVDDFTISFELTQNDILEKTSWFTAKTEEDGTPVLEIGKSDADAKMNLTNEELAFIIKNQKVAYMSSTAMYNTNLIVQQSFELGKFKAVADDAGVSWI